MTSEDWLRVHKATGDIGLTVAGAMGAGSPLRYLWIPFAFVLAVAAVISLIG